MTTYKDAIATKGATFRLILTDHRGHVTVQIATNRTDWLAASNRALRAEQFDPGWLDGKRSSERRQARYVRCESVCILPTGEEVPCGLWTQTEATDEPIPARLTEADVRNDELLRRLMAVTP